MSAGPPHDMLAFNRQVVEQFRASGGVGTLGPIDFEHVVLLTTTGRRSGEPRTVVLGAARDGADNLLLFASNMGAPAHPLWYRNIEADVQVTVEVTGARWTADAEILTGAERQDAYDRWIAMAPHVADHEARAGRRIPMVRVRRP